MKVIPKTKLKTTKSTKQKKMLIHIADENHPYSTILNGMENHNYHIWMVGWLVNGKNIFKKKKEKQQQLFKYANHVRNEKKTFISLIEFSIYHYHYDKKKSGQS